MLDDRSKVPDKVISGFAAFIDRTHKDAFERLRAMGVERISAVGGRGLATELIDADLVQDLYLRSLHPWTLTVN